MRDKPGETGTTAIATKPQSVSETKREAAEVGYVGSTPAIVTDGQPSEAR